MKDFFDSAISRVRILLCYMSQTSKCLFSLDFAEKKFQQIVLRSYFIDRGFGSPVVFDLYFICFRHLFGPTSIIAINTAECK